MPAATRNAAELRYAFRIKVAEGVEMLLKTLLWVFCVCYLGREFFQMLTNVASANEGSISALAKVVEKFSFDRIVMLILNAVTGAGWYLSRSRNKRLTEPFGEGRHAIEHNDKVNDRSGLDKYGRLKGE